MNNIESFANRIAFRQWLQVNCHTSPGIWLLFGKSGGPKTLSSSEALEEALCFGWIDGQMKSIDAGSYKKYFSLRTKNSKWSEKNKLLTEKLEQQGNMTEFGRFKIEEAKKNGQWNAPKNLKITDQQILALETLLKENNLAYSNFQAMSLSIKKTYTRAYFDAKTEVGRVKRLSWIIDRLEKNLKPM